MPGPDEKNGPAKRPVQMIPPLEQIIREGNREIGRQVREAVEKAVASGVAVDPARLRKWGPDGADYFVRKLRERIMPPPLPVDAKDLTASANKADESDATEVSKTSASPRRSTPLIKTEKDWIHQEHGRWSIATRAIARGLLVATMLLLAAILISRMPF
jgi:hypothetical protein